MPGPLDVVPPGLAEHAQAVIREAVSNAVRHAATPELTVTVSVDDDLVIDVTDNGIGIPGTVARSGLHNLRQRAEEAGGVFHGGPEPQFLRLGVGHPVDIGSEAVFGAAAAEIEGDAAVTAGGGAEREGRRACGAGSGPDRRRPAGPARPRRW